MLQLLAIGGDYDVSVGRKLYPVEEPRDVRLRVGGADRLHGDRLALEHALSFERSRELWLAELALSCKIARKLMQEGDSGVFSTTLFLFCQWIEIVYFYIPVIQNVAMKTTQTIFILLDEMLLDCCNLK